MKVIIIEGPDNCGKDTLIKGLSKHFNDDVTIIHAGVPNSQDLYSYYYDGLIHDTLANYYKNDKAALIHNRSIYGEYVYGPKYRGLSKEEAAKLIYSLEVGQLKTFIFGWDLHLIVLTSSDVDLLVKNDDGLSISNKREDISDEINAFLEIYEKSTIKNKKLIHVNIGSKFRPIEDILSEAINTLI